MWFSGRRTGNSFAYGIIGALLLMPAAGKASSLMFKANLERTGVYDDVGPKYNPRLVWKFDAGSAVFSTPLVYKGIVYFVSFEGILYAVSESGGSVVWEKDLGGNPSFQITMNDDVILVGYHFNEGEGGYLIAMDRLSGEEHWRFKPTSLVGIDNLTIYGDKVLFTSLSFSLPGSLFALEIKTGKKVWSKPVSGGSKHPFIYSSSLYYQDEYQAIYSIHPDNGEAQWEYSPAFTKRLSFSTPAVDGCCIYALIANKEDGSIVKINRHDGSEIDHFPVPAYSISSISLADGVVFFGDDGGRQSSRGHMNALDIESGQMRWRFETGGFVRGAASIAGDIVYFGSHDNFMYAVDRHTGEMKWKFETGAGINSTPAVSGGRLYFGSIDGHVYVLE